MVKEIEVKFKVEKKDRIVQKLNQLGGRAKKPYSQTTFGFFSADSMQKGIFPRIRYEFKKAVLTVKAKNLNKKSNYFERDEYTVKVFNFRSAFKIIELLGYDQIRKFTKIRTHWIFSKRKIQATLDRLYFGTFIELEGSEQEIEKMIIDLGFLKKERITRAYLALEDEWKKNH